ncbi:MAG: C1 family peptidase [Flavobacteriales bacterium]|jgi:bleomycin hydrolase|nr:C1 family peptidase [Flavobacteriales bacterium]
MKAILKQGLVGVFMSASVLALGQEKFETNKEGSEYKFKVIKDLEATDVQNQGRTGTCWSFSSLSFFESEILRLGHGKHNLSEMFIARNAYIGKAENFLRMYGTFTFGPGGAFHDIPWVIRRYGIVPEEVYKGLNYGDTIHRHAEMEAILGATVKELAKKPQNDHLTPVWKKAYTGILDAYLGDLPDNVEDFKFTYEGKEYTPKSYSESLGLNMDDYVSLTSYTHHPFYSQFVLEVQDNWAMQSGYNLPLDEFMQVMEDAIKNGYTFAWGADVSEKGFNYRDALAILPEDESTIKREGRDNKHFSDAGAKKISNAFVTPVKERIVTQEERQIAFDNQETTDDHGMHVTGLVEDQNGTKYFIVKNSWGKSNECDGYFYASFPYARYKTMNILIHKDAINKKLQKKLGIK